MTDIEKVVSLIFECADRGCPFTAVFSKNIGNAPKKQKAKLCRNNGSFIVSLEEEYEFGRVSQRNVSVSDVRNVFSELSKHYNRINIIVNGIAAEYRESKKGKTILIGADKIQKVLNSYNDGETEIEELNRKKSYFISGREEFLFHLGISDKNGRIHDKKQGKFRQINHFIEQIENIMYALPSDGKLTVYDLCCGKSYLSFAVYYYLTKCKNRDVYMLCIDQRSEVIEYCSGIASLCDFSNMHFVCDDVRNTPKNVHPNLLISLHACDIATDIVIDEGIDLSVDVILSTPCCHRYMNDMINASELSFITSLPHLRNKLCEAATDAIRACRLRANGYSVAVCELTDPENTPKNTLIRAVKNNNFDVNSQKAIKLKKEYESILYYLLGDKAKDYLKEIK